MFGFGKKKENSINEDILYTLEDEPIINTSTGEFLQNYDNEQKKYIRLMLDHGVSVITFAYPSLPWQFYKLIQEAVLPFNGSVYYQNAFDEAILYRMVHTNLDTDQFRDCLRGMIAGIDMCKEIENIGSYPHPVLNNIATMAENGFNMCKDLSPDMDYEEFMLKIRKNLHKQEKKERSLLKKFKTITKLTT